jgi:flavin reductase (DIM6/NTAB) family NADH-FMN oxidoreductase RutF
MQVAVNVTTASAVDVAQLKRAARRFASAVTVVTAWLNDGLYGGTGSAFFSLSLEPLQVLISSTAPVVWPS